MKGKNRGAEGEGGVLSPVEGEGGEVMRGFLSDR